MTPPGIDELPLQRLYRWERERGGRTFLTQPYGGGKVREWTWAQAASEARSMAAYLKAQGWEPGTRIAILSKNCAWWILADLAIWMAGHVSVPIYPSLRAESVRKILEHCEAKLCFVGATDERETGMQGIPPDMQRICFQTATANCGPSWDQVIDGVPPILGNPTRASDDLATIIYTSGTTGVPKGVMHKFSALAFLAKSLTEALEFNAEHRILSYLPLAHIIERTGMEGPAIIFGWHLYFAETLETFIADLQRARPTIFLSIPRLLLKFQQGVFEKLPRRKYERLTRIPILSGIIKRKILRGLGLDKVRYAACGSAPLTPELLNWYRDLGLNLLEGYGLTEALITHLTRPGHVRAGYVGNALAGIEMKVTESSELLLRSPMNMVGYFRDPAGTAAAFTEDGFFRTGDTVEIDSEGRVRIVGRVKEQFKTSKGKYVVPAPIESKLIADPDFESCCLMGAGLTHPFAVAVLTEEARTRTADPQARRAFEEKLRARLEQVNSQLDPHERLAFIAIVDGPWTIANGLMTPTLKIRRSALETMYMSLVDRWVAQNKPVVWESVLEDGSGVLRAGGGSAAA